jgi:hypothetical protein
MRISVIALSLAIAFVLSACATAKRQSNITLNQADQNSEYGI